MNTEIYVLNFDLTNDEMKVFNKTKEFEARNEDEAIGKLMDLLDKKNIERNRASNLTFTVKKKQQ